MESLSGSTPSRNPDFKTILILSLIVVLPLIGYWLYSHFIVPISAYYENYDPEFIYFLNSLAALRGGSYTYIDHPGTPLELIGSAILLATYPFVFHAQGGFTLYHLEHPELFLGLAHAFIGVMSIGCALLFYYTALTSKSLEKRLSSAALSMMFFVIHPSSFLTLNTWSHNSFNFAFGTLLLVVLYRATRRGGEVPLGKLVGIGLGLGVLNATTIYFVGWIAGSVITVVVLYGLQRLPWGKTALAGLVVTASSCIGFFVSTLPVLSLYPQLINWVKALMFHQGIYGLGPEGITTPALIVANFSMLVRDLPVLFMTVGVELSLLLGAFLLWRRRISERPGLWALAAGLGIQILLEIVIIVKHPTDSYMLAVAASAPVLMMVILEIFEAAPALNRILTRVLIFGVLVGLANAWYASILDHRILVDYVNNAVTQTSQAIQEFANLANRNPDDLTIYWTYQTYSPCQSLQFGDNGTSREVSLSIRKICNHQRAISIWANNPSVFSGKWDLAITRKGYLTAYSMFDGIGVLYKELSATTNEYGPIVILSHTK